MIMSGPQRLSAEAFAADLLRDEPNLDYATIRERAKSAGISVQPIHYGRARKQLGLPALRDSRPEPRPTQGRPVASTGEIAATRTDEAIAETPRMQPDADAETTPPEADDDKAETPVARAVDEMVSPRRKGSPAFDYLLQQLRNEPNILYAALRDRCATQGFTIAPIMYGRAKAVLGLVPVKPRGKKAAATAGKMPTPGVPMQLKQVESVAADRFAKKLDEVRNLEQLVAIVKDLDTERRRLRDVIERVVTLLDAALSPS